MPPQNRLSLKRSRVAFETGGRANREVNAIPAAGAARLRCAPTNLTTGVVRGARPLGRDIAIAFGDRRRTAPDRATREVGLELVVFMSPATGMPSFSRITYSLFKWTRLTTAPRLMRASVRGRRAGLLDMARGIDGDPSVHQFRAISIRRLMGHDFAAGVHPPHPQGRVNGFCGHSAPNCDVFRHVAARPAGR